MQSLFKDKPPGSICLMRLSAVGDVCNAVPLVRALQRHWPAARITWVIGKLEASLVGDIPGIEFIIFNKADGWRAFRRLRQVLAGRKFDLLLHIQAALRASIATLVIPARVRLGFDSNQARDFQRLFVNARIPDLHHPHVLDGFMGFATQLGIDDQSLRWDLPLPPDAVAFSRQHLGDQDRALVISPCSSQRARNWRNWEAKNYAAISRHVIEQHDMKVILTGGPTQLEAQYGKEIESLVPQTVTNLIGKTTLKQLLAILARATVLVCPDSGPAHMATSVGLPVVGLYATSNPQRTGPYMSREWVVNRYPDACHQFLGKDPAELRWGKRVRDPRAMNLISVSDVTNKLDMLLASEQQSTGVSA
ncbi:MAG: glycosyltransferase family 9 protein [Gammaproteobacteria bacterium]|nr:glycosyltransferase family 9 protein [Gammaproteobacteria bacterium]